MGIELISPYLREFTVIMEDSVLITVILYQTSIFYLISKQAEKKICPEAHGQTTEWVALEKQTYFMYLITIIL
jgi:hypothetical protein